MSETLKFSSRLDAVRTAQEWPVSLPLPTRNPPEKTVSPFTLVASPFNPEPATADPTSALPLVKALCDELKAENVTYCHWKSNWKLDRWLGGEGDLDLLVAAVDAQRFVSTALRLGFVQAVKPQQSEPHGIVHFYGWDNEAEKFVHLHVYSRLLVGHDLTSNYRLPVEEMLLSSVVQTGLMPIPQPEIELIVFVVRKVLSGWGVETLLRRMTGRSSDFRKTASELDHLESHTDRQMVQQLLSTLFPAISYRLFERCLESLRLESSIAKRAAVRSKLEKVMAAHARRGRRLDGMTKVWRLSRRLFSDHLLRQSGLKHSVNGGALIAFVGGDGSGKTTAVKGVRKWLSQAFDVRTFHFGKPKRSPVTLAVIVALRGRELGIRLLKTLRLRTSEAASSTNPGYLRMVRWVCASRDRLRVYRKARRFTNNGGIAICDRYVLPQIQLMDGPNIANALRGTKLTWIHRAMLRAENKRYEEIMQPDLLLVLRVDPEVAVQRKTDEREQHVRPRSQEIWETDWTGTRARVIDAGQSAEAVLAELRAQVWQQI